MGDSWDSDSVVVQVGSWDSDSVADPVGNSDSAAVVVQEGNFVAVVEIVDFDSQHCLDIQVEVDTILQGTASDHYMIAVVVDWIDPVVVSHLEQFDQFH